VADGRTGTSQPGRNERPSSLFDGVTPSDDLTLEDHAFMAGITGRTGEMIDAAVQANLQRALRAQVERLIGEWRV
jgi:hypothetical protein